MKSVAQVSVGQTSVSALHKLAAAIALVAPRKFAAKERMDNDSVALRMASAAAIVPAHATKPAAKGGTGSGSVLRQTAFVAGTVRARLGSSVA
jgi:hypothetical protein